MRKTNLIKGYYEFDFSSFFNSTKILPYLYFEIANNNFYVFINYLSNQYSELGSFEFNFNNPIL